MDDFRPALTPPPSFICNKKYYDYQANMVIYT